MTDYKAVLDSMLQEIEIGTLKADQEDGMAFVSGALANDEFAKLGLNTMIETAKKAAGVMMMADSKEDAIAMFKTRSVCAPLMEFGYLCMRVGKRSQENSKMEDMFSTASALDTQESV